jgi:protein arginine kinase
MTIADLIQAPGDWLKADGPFPEMVLSSRVRLARNLVGYPFVRRMKVSSQREVLDQIDRVAQESPFFSEHEFLTLKECSPLDLLFLVERHLISVEMADGGAPRGLLFGNGETLSVMVNEEDHLRIQSLKSGMQIAEAFRAADTLDDELSKYLDYAYSEKWGYLTACPTNTGTGIRASVLIHLPGLVHTKEIDKVLRGVSQIGFTVRGMYGEGTEVKGNFFQISNQITLGQSEEQIINRLDEVAKQIVDHEQKAREVLVTDARLQLEDKIWRAYGILTHARLLTSEDVLNLTSAVRLGVGLGLVRDVGIQALNELIIFTQPAHLQKIYDMEMRPAVRDEKRAQYVRRKINEMP